MTEATENAEANEGTGAAATEAAAAAATEGTAAEATAGTEPAAAPTEQAAEPAANAPVRPEGLPDEFWDDAKGLKGADLFAAYRDLKTQTDTARADVPEAADGYELAVSDAVEVPEGFVIDTDKDSPFFKEFAAAAHEAGMPKAAVQKMVDASARQQIAAQETVVTDYADQMSGLGDRAKERTEAAKNWVLANLPEKEANALLNNMGPGAVPALERIIALRSGPDMPGGTGAPAKGERKFGDGWFTSMPAKT